MYLQQHISVIWFCDIYTVNSILYDWIPTFLHHGNHSAGCKNRVSCSSFIKPIIHSSFTMVVFTFLIMVKLLSCLTSHCFILRWNQTLFYLDSKAYGIPESWQDGMSMDSISGNTGRVNQMVTWRNARTSQIRERLDHSQPDGLEHVCALRECVCCLSSVWGQFHTLYALLQY